MVRALVIIVGTADPAASPPDNRDRGFRRTVSIIARRGGSSAENVASLAVRLSGRWALGQPTNAACSARCASSSFEGSMVAEIRSGPAESATADAPTLASTPMTLPSAPLAPVSPYPTTLTTA